MVSSFRGIGNKKAHKNLICFVGFFFAKTNLFCEDQSFLRRLIFFAKTNLFCRLNNQDGILGILRFSKILIKRLIGPGIIVSPFSYRLNWRSVMPRNFANGIWRVLSVSRSSLNCLGVMVYLL